MLASFCLEAGFVKIEDGGLIAAYDLAAGCLSDDFCGFIVLLIRCRLVLSPNAEATRFARGFASSFSLFSELSDARFDGTTVAAFEVSFWATAFKGG